MGDEMAIGDSIERHLKESVECLWTSGVVLPRSDFVKQTPVCVDPKSPAANGSCETLYVKHRMKETILFELTWSVTCDYRKIGEHLQCQHADDQSRSLSIAHATLPPHVMCVITGRPTCRLSGEGKDYAQTDGRDP